MKQDEPTKSTTPPPDKKEIRINEGTKSVAPVQPTKPPSTPPPPPPPAPKKDDGG